jgi:DNA-binding MarR family transcriptional regulator
MINNSKEINLKKYQDKLKIYEEEVINTWVDPDEDADIVFDRYKKLNEIMQPMYDLVLSYSNYYSIRKDYGTGVELTMIEVHILQDLMDPEFQTVSSLATKWKRSNSAISQIIRKLEDKELLKRSQNEDDRKSYTLTLTSLGQQTVLAHSRYDNIDIVKTHKKLFNKFSPEELAIFFTICESYNDLLEENQDV